MIGKYLCLSLSELRSQLLVSVTSQPEIQYSVIWSLYDSKLTEGRPPGIIFCWKAILEEILEENVLE